MTTIRRTLSPVPKPGTSLSGESTSFAVASPLSKCSSCNHGYNHSNDNPSSFGSMEYVLYTFQTFLLNLFSKRSSRSLDKQKPKANPWRRSLFHFFVCFLVGVFLGFTPIVSVNTSNNLMSRNQAFSFEQVGKVQLDDDDVTNHVMSTKPYVPSNVSYVKQENATTVDKGVVDKVVVGKGVVDKGVGKFLVIVTATPTRNRRSVYYLKRLANTLRLVEPPLLWIVVEMTSQSGETAELLRKSGVMYRHLVCTTNITESKDPRAHQRNVALSHIETHRLDGIVYFADDSNIYSAQLFNHMRQIRRFGTWPVAKLKKNRRVVTFVGPVCNGTEVIGWHTDDLMRRFHADLSGFAFNSTILWDPKKQPIRHLDTVKDRFQASAFIKQIIEDESEMEGIPEGCSEVLVWDLPMEINQLSSFNTTILDPVSLSN